MWKAAILFLFFCHCNSQNGTENSSTTPASNTTQNNSAIKQRMVVVPCTTPNGEDTYCMPLDKCPALLNQLDNKEAKNFLRASKCGPKNENKTNPYVCCGKHSYYVSGGVVKHGKLCGHQNVTIRGRIFGGKQAVIGEFPWMARLYHRDRAGSRMFGCTGFLVSQKFVLTAGHCIESENNEIFGPVFEVHLGEHNTETAIDCDSRNKTCADKVQIIKVRKSIVHPSYNTTSRHHHNDIGLIYLNKGAKFTNYVSPICLIEKHTFKLFEYWLSGWGQTEVASQSNIKLKVSVPPFPRQNCTELYKTIGVKIADTQMCAGGKKGKDSCAGDSGGPLMVVVDGNNWFAAGVVSYGLNCGLEGWPAVYTNITSYFGWIKSTISEISVEDKKKTVNKS